ncbi:hypothetical protein B4O97_07200 [Marispirochaeta aestuarii]|uniref:Uncharacterized protein n=1 Tax=Marispirochaeta aestuarii TaxID=1963862 RepID=A0A1Y1RYV9_9SPIO|nr:hypothetical protein [Marispirochaeta aestuarii]ORC35849.1 hypothetical protein B4O97_07200 [Marispirochaeta aestuarii]
MKRSAVFFLFIFIVLLTGCGREERTKVILRDYDNSAGTGEVFLTLSSEFFIPTWGASVNLSTSIVPMASVRDVALLDVSESDALDRYYLYVLEDTVDDNMATVNDQFWPVIELTPKKGQTLELYGFVNDTSQSVPFSPDSRSFLRFDYRIPELPAPDRPLYLQLIAGSGTMDFTVMNPDISIPITSPAALNILCFFLTPGQSYTYFAFLDMDSSGTPTAGDYASVPDAAAVTDSFTAYNGDSEIMLPLSGIRL